MCGDGCGLCPTLYPPVKTNDQIREFAQLISYMVASGSVQGAVDLLSMWQTSTYIEGQTFGVNMARTVISHSEPDRKEFKL